MNFTPRKLMSGHSVRITCDHSSMKSKHHECTRNSRSRNNEMSITAILYTNSLCKRYLITCKSCRSKLYVIRIHVFTYIWNYFEVIWRTMESFGAIWSELGDIELFRTIEGPPKQFWPTRSDERFGVISNNKCNTE